MPRVIVIGSGFSSLSAACYLARAGYSVSVYEKNSGPGGRARQMHRDGFTFDMGPTFYWMPDIFERFFADFGTTPGKYYDLIRLDPGYRIFFGPGDSFDQPAGLSALLEAFERLETGSGAKLSAWLRGAGYNYRTAVDKVIYRPGKSPLELVMPATAARLPQFVASLGGSVSRRFRSPLIRQMLGFPVLFLGATPGNTPSFYRFMNYADMVLGSWHVVGGMVKVAGAMVEMAGSMGVEFHYGSPVEGIDTDGRRVKSVTVGGRKVPTRAVVSGADYAHTESLLPPRARNFREGYWDKRVFAPSALLYYVALDRPVENVRHHTLFFDSSFDKHAQAVYGRPDWPAEPVFYASFPSKTDPGMAPPGKECAIILIPTAPGLEEDGRIKARYFDTVIERMERVTGQSIRPHVLFYESYGCRDFMSEYNSCKGNAYGLANTLTQTAFMRPPLRNRHLENMFYTGQLTVPGPGVPTALVSGKVAAGEVLRYLQKA